MSGKKVRVQDAMSCDSYQLVDGMVTVAEGIKLAKKYNVPADIFLFEFNLDFIKILYQSK